MKGIINKKNLCFSIVPGIIIGLMLVSGYYSKHLHGFFVNADTIVAFLVVSVVSIFVVYTVFLLIDKIAKKQITKTHKEALPNRIIKRPLTYFFVMWGVMFVCWIPSFLALMPGLFVYDAPWQYYMFTEYGVTEHHPVLHTYLVGAVIDGVYKLTGSFNQGVAAYEIVQMLIIGAGVGYIFYVFYKKNAPTWIHIFTLLFLGFFPTCVIFVFAITKEGIFSIAVADFCLANFLLIDNPEDFFKKKLNVALWIIFALIVCIFRNNAIYALAITIPFFVVSMIKSRVKLWKPLVMLLTTVVLMAIYKYPVTSALTVGGINQQEMLSMPGQQMARTYLYNYDKLTESQREGVEGYFLNEEWKNYVPGSADYTKGSIDSDKIKNDIGKFLRFWLGLGLQYPEEYISATVENIYSLWYPWPVYVSYTEGGTSYSPMTSITPATQISKFPALYEFYKQFDNGSIVADNVFTAWIFSPALFLYFSLICAFYVLKEKKKAFGIPFLFCALYWLTFLLGPYGLVRYVLFYYICVPVWLCVLDGRLFPGISGK